MDLDDTTGTQARFRAYAADLASVDPFKDYCIGLLSAEGRKSVEPLAAVTAPERTGAQHQSLLHFVAQAPWSDQAMLRRVREHVLPSITRDEPIQAWIIDDTGFPKKGSHSVGVGRQYCGQLGKQDNCQVAVSLSVATHQGSLPVAYRLYLPRERTDEAFDSRCNVGTAVVHGGELPALLMHPGRRVEIAQTDRCDLTVRWRNNVDGLAPRHITAHLRRAIAREPGAKSQEGCQERPYHGFQVRLHKNALHSAIQPFSVLPRTTHA
jgi:DDE superfamily endonuclease